MLDVRCREKQHIFTWEPERTDMDLNFLHSDYGSKMGFEAGKHFVDRVTINISMASAFC